MRTVVRSAGALGQGLGLCGAKAILPPRQKSSTKVGLFSFEGLADENRGSIRRSFRAGSGALRG